MVKKEERETGEAKGLGQGGRLERVLWGRKKLIANPFNDRLVQAKKKGRRSR